MKNRLIDEIYAAKKNGDHDFSLLGVRLDLGSPYVGWDRAKQMEVMGRWWPEIALLEHQIDKIDLDFVRGLKTWVVAYQRLGEQKLLDRVWSYRPLSLAVTKMYLPGTTDSNRHVEIVAHE
jgi:hypothetical protein